MCRYCYDNADMLKCYRLPHLNYKNNENVLQEKYYTAYSYKYVYYKAGRKQSFFVLRYLGHLALKDSCG